MSTQRISRQQEPARERVPAAARIAPAAAGGNGTQPAAAPTAKIRDFVGSLARGLSVLRSFDAEKPEMTLTEVAGRTRLTRAGARRFLLTLVELGYVRKNHRLFRLTPKVLELGYAFMSSMPISERSHPYLKQVTEHTGETCSLAVLDNDDVVYMGRSPAKRMLILGLHVGARLPASYTSMGRVLLAYKSPEEIDAYLHRVQLQARTGYSITNKTALRSEFAKIRRQGYALLDQELEEGLRSIAVPVRDTADNVVAAINISTHAGSVSTEKLMGEFLPVLQQAAIDIRKTL